MNLPEEPEVTFRKKRGLMIAAIWEKAEELDLDLIEMACIFAVELERLLSRLRQPEPEIPES